VRVFLDANVLFAAAHSPSGRARALFRLSEAGCCTLLASEHAVAEARRNLTRKSPQGTADLDGLLARVERVAEAGPRAVEWAGGYGLPDNDAPILAAAVAAKADLLATGDRTHFGHLFGTAVGGVRVVSLAVALEAVLGS